ncbi:AAA family ATPase [Salinarchaeum sp. IM2453]|uniref:Cdc6/Cdc18 family protein n=1 Tax=Salinarchaeum sp. IM2453 TaxID=2862870 RepID=UPI001C835568|nr:AAA family ATPase [Salinarchaeum sp. IM2453]QZA89534.1 AAA family ATPase [Salinarchaeum sp. IM2453]
MLTAPHVFDDTHLPARYPHRDAELEQCYRLLEPALHNRRADNLLLSGPSGVGKTSLARYVTRTLQERTQLHTVHVRCIGSTTGQILRTIQRGITEERVPENQPVTTTTQQLKTTIDQPAVIILDEADELPETDVLQELQTLPQLSVIVIIHDPTHWLSQITTDMAHNLDGDNHIGLDRYTVDELADILEDRANRGLPPNAVTRTQLERIADEAAGVARRGIQALYAAAQIAAERNHTQIQSTDIDDCFPRARRQIRKSNLRSLPFHHQVLYAILHQADELTSRELHQRYEQLADEVYATAAVTPIGKRARRDKLRKLQSYDLVEQHGENRWRRYTVRDQTVTPTVTLPETTDTIVS